MKYHSYKYLLVPLLGFVLAFTFCSTNPVAAQEEPQHNILIIREAYIKDGKFMEAVAFAKEIMAYSRSKLPPNGRGRLYIEVLGDFKMYWIIEHKDLATMERNNALLFADPGYHAILNKGVGLFIEGKTHDTVLRLIP